MATDAEALERVLAELRRSRRYRDVCEAVARRAAEDALARSGGEVRAAAKRAKRALHQIYGAFVPAPLRAEHWLAELEASLAAGADVRDVLREILAAHASTRERLPVLGRFYAEIFAATGRPRRVLDLGCGLAPLAAPWMGLEPGARYVGVELEHGLVRFVAAALELLGVDAEIRAQDLLAPAPLPESDVAFALKLWPTLEQQGPGRAAELLGRVHAAHIVASFPRRSLGGRGGKALERAPAEAFLTWAGRERGAVKTLEFPDELVYVAG